MQALGVADVGNEGVAELRRSGHAPAHHFELAFAVGGIDANDRRHHVGEDRRQHRQVAGEIARDSE
jgi:hypothetical protein